MPKNVYNTEQSRSGFAPLVIIILVAVLLIGGVAFVAGRPKDQSSPFQGFQGGQHDNELASEGEWPALWGGPDNKNKCQKNTNMHFVYRVCPPYRIFPGDSSRKFGV